MSGENDNSENSTNDGRYGEGAEECLCMKDGVRVSIDMPRCIHPSGFCPHRHHCAVISMSKENR